MKSKGIIHQLYLLLIVLFVFALLNLAAMYSAIDRMTADGRIINFTGIVRGKSQRIVKLEWVQQPTDSQITEIEQIVRGLVNGSKELGLPTPKNADFQAQTVALEAGWKQLLNQIQNLREQSIQPDRLLAESEIFWELANTTVFAAEALAKQNINYSKKVALFVCLGNFILLVVMGLIIRKIAYNLQQTVQILASSSSQIAITVEEHERTVSQQSDAVNNTNSALKQLAVSTQTTAEQARSQRDRTSEVLILVREGQETADKTLLGMSILQEQVDSIALQMEQLNQQMARISMISQVVKELATQTHSLALNATIEAVRAEAYGAGFAVIAKEIRQLAHHSQQSAEQINHLVEEIQDAIDRAFQATILGKKTARDSAEKVQIDTDRFHPMIEAIANVAENSQHISQIVTDQANTIAKVVGEMQHLDFGMKDNAIAIGQTKIAIQYLQDVSFTLKTMV